MINNSQIQDDFGSFVSNSGLLLETIVNSIQDAILYVSPERKIVKINQAAIDIFGYSQAELYALSTEALHIDKDHYDEFGRIISAAFAEGRVAFFEFEAKRKSGEVFPTENTVTQFINDQGQPLGILSVVKDISARKQLQMQRDQAIKLSGLGEIAAGVAHEINNPISGVINYAQLLLNKKPDPSRTKDLLERIMTEGNRVAGIVASLLNFSRMPGDTFEFVEPFDLFTEPLNLLKNSLRKDNIQLEINLSRNLPHVFCNKKQMEQVIMNILVNAKHALNQSPPTKTAKTITISAQADDAATCVQFTLLDTGVGIPHHDLNQVFTPFFTTKNSREGTGLGLSIAKDLLAKAGGDIVIESSAGEYTKVTFTLPTQRN